MSKSSPGHSSESDAIVDLVLPDLGLGDVPALVSLWLVDVGQEVTVGDRLLEIVAGGVTVDLPSPASGILIAANASEDEIVVPGQVLGRVATQQQEAD